MELGANCPSMNVGLVPRFHRGRGNCRRRHIRALVSVVGLNLVVAACWAGASPTVPSPTELRSYSATREPATREPSAVSAPSITTDPSITTAPSAEPYALQVTNVDGPTTDVLVNGVLAASVACGSGARIVEGTNGVSSPPWDLVASRDGKVLFQARLSGGGEPDFLLLIRAGGVGFSITGGPTAEPCPTA